MSGQVIDRDIEVPVAKGKTRSRKRLAPKRLALSVFGIILLVCAVLYGEQWWKFGRFVETTDDAYVGGNVTPIAPHVAGFVARILVRDNQYVHAGQPIIRLDDRNFIAALDRARAVVRQRQAALVNLAANQTLQTSMIAEAAANLTAKQASAAFAAEDAARYRMLARSKAASRQEAQKALATTRSAQSVVAAARASLAAARQRRIVVDAEIKAARAAIAEARAALRTKNLDLSYTIITAPIDGYIGDRAAQLGAYVPVGAYLLSIVPAHGLWVDANFKEDELARMKPGDPATIVMDVRPGQHFRGHVVSLAPATGAVFSVIPAQNATGNFTKIVQRVPVRIALDGNAAQLALLRPGLSTTISVDTKQHR